MKIHVDKYDRLHNASGPAIDGEGHKEYFINGIPHRIDGPSVSLTYNTGHLGGAGHPGFFQFHVDGKLHNPFGPAVINHIHKDGKWIRIEEYFLYGKSYDNDVAFAMHESHAFVDM